MLFVGDYEVKSSTTQTIGTAPALSKANSEAEAAAGKRHRGAAAGRGGCVRGCGARLVQIVVL